MKHILILLLVTCVGCGTFGPGTRKFNLNVLGNTVTVESETYGPTTLGQPEAPSDVPPDGE